MVQSQKVPKRASQKRNFSAHRQNSYSHFRSNASYQQPPRFQPQQRSFYVPPHQRLPPQHQPPRYDRWQQAPQPQYLPTFIPPTPIQFQMQQPPQQISYFNNPPHLMPNWGPPPAIRQVPVQPPMPLPFRKHYYEEPRVPYVVPIKEAIIPQEEKEVSIEKEFDNISMEAARSSNNSYNSMYGNVCDNAVMMETTEEPGPEEKALPDFDLDDPIFEIGCKKDYLDVNDTIPSSKIPVKLCDENFFGIFISEVNNPAIFWFHLQSEGQELGDLMYDLE